MKYQVNVYYISEYSYTIEAKSEEDVEEIALEMTEDSDGTLVNSDVERVEIRKLENEKNVIIF